jgi:hypothetical protein
MGVWNVIDVSGPTYSRCDGRGCDKYDAHFARSGEFVIIDIPGLGFTAKLAADISAFVEGEYLDTGIGELRRMQTGWWRANQMKQPMLVALVVCFVGAQSAAGQDAAKVRNALNNASLPSVEGYPMMSDTTVSTKRSHERRCSLGISGTRFCYRVAQDLACC